jgi:exopolysaccharide biosynthesis polyprenyl glycosylphosphotransferase
MASVVLDSQRTRSNSLLSRQNQRHLLVAMIVAGDIVALFLAFALAYFVRFETNLVFFEDVSFSASVHRWIIPILIPFWIAVLAAFQLYNVHYLLGGTREYARVFNACAVALSLIVLITFFAPLIRISRGWIAISWVLAVIFVVLARFGVRRIAYLLRRHGFLTSRTLIVGTDEEAIAIAEQLSATPTAGAVVVGFVTNHTPTSPQLAGSSRLVGSTDQLPALVSSLDIDELIVSTATLHRNDLLEIFENFGNSDQVELRFSSGLYELYTAGVHVREIGNVPLVCMNKVRLDPVEAAIKSTVDRILVIVAFLAFWPFLIAIAILIKLDSPGPALYRRRVLGCGRREFDAFKFRTMYTDGDAILEQHPELVQQLKSDFKLKGDPRVTRVGKWLRRFSLDELPQLVNVLRGQMSLVGPRMITTEEGAKYGRLRMNLLTVKPGLTGLWQVKGRSDVSYDERVRLDMYYIRNYSIWLDIQILLQTFPAVLRGRGAY